MPVSASFRPDSSTSSQVFKEVNAYRRSVGAGELQRHAGLDRLAQEHSEYLRKHRGTFSLNGKNVSHIGFDGRVQVARERYQLTSLGENVAAAGHLGNNPAPALVKLWKGSDAHHKNMIDDWTYCGVGVVVDTDGMVFATQIFGTMTCSLMENRERFDHF